MIKKSRKDHAAAVCLAASMVIAACSTTSGEADQRAIGSTTSTSVHEAFWEPLRIDGDEVEGFESLEQMGASADIVLTATFSDYGRGRAIQGDAEEDEVTYATATLQAVDVFAGDLPEPLSVEFLVVPESGDVAEAIERQASSIPTDEVLLFLREKQGEETGRYRLVNSTGLWVADPNGLRAPLAEPVMLDGEASSDEEWVPYDVERGTGLEDLARQATVSR